MDGVNSWAGWISLGVSLLTFVFYVANFGHKMERDRASDVRDDLSRCRSDLRDTVDDRNALRRENERLLRRIARLDNGTEDNQ